MVDSVLNISLVVVISLIVVVVVGGSGILLISCRVALLDGLGSVHRIHKVAHILLVLIQIVLVVVRLHRDRGLLVRRLIVDADVLVHLVRVVRGSGGGNTGMAAVGVWLPCGVVVWA